MCPDYNVSRLDFPCQFSTVDCRAIGFKANHLLSLYEDPRRSLSLGVGWGPVILLVVFFGTIH